jgi:CHRD domain
MVWIVSRPLRRFVVVLALAVLCAVVFAVPASAARSGTVSTKLTGKEEVPPIFTKGRGKAEIKPKPDELEICYKLKVSDLHSPTREAHIHKGPPGTNGPRVVNLTPPPGTDGEIDMCQPEPNRNLLIAISKHPHRYYVNIHTVEFPEGEVRGNLERGKLPAR